MLVENITKIRYLAIAEIAQNNLRKVIMSY